MSRIETRSQMMRVLGAKQANAVWGTCAVNEDSKKVYFSVWADKVKHDNGENRFVIQEALWGVDKSGKKSPARNDHDKKMKLVFDEGYEAFGYFIVAVDPNAEPRQIETTRTSFVMRLEPEKLDDGSVVSALVERIEIN